jgi:hypothetical protein
VWAEHLYSELLKLVYETMNKPLKPPEQELFTAIVDAVEKYEAAKGWSI